MNCVESESAIKQSAHVSRETKKTLIFKANPLFRRHFLFPKLRQKKVSRETQIPWTTKKAAFQNPFFHHCGKLVQNVEVIAGLVLWNVSRETQVPKKYLRDYF